MKVAVLSRGDSDVCARLCAELSRAAGVELLTVLTHPFPKPSLRRIATAAKLCVIARWRSRLWGEQHSLVPTPSVSYVLVEDEAAAIDPIRAFAPDVLVISGTKKVSDDILSAARVALNIHHGLVPLYRGVSSPDWVTLERNYN
jgi:methionyl-tRNA formyltransferase